MKKLLLLAILVAASLQDSQTSRSFDGLSSPPEYLTGNQIVFVNEGELANQIGFVHVRMVFKLGITKKSIEDARANLDRSISEETKELSNNLLKSNNSNVREAQKSLAMSGVNEVYSFMLKSVAERIDKFYLKFTNTLVGLPNSEEENLASQNLYHIRHRQQRSGTLAEDANEVLDREKRSLMIGALGAILGLGGTILGGISLSRLQELHTKFGNLERDHNKLVDISEAQGDALSDLCLDQKVMEEVVRYMHSRNGAVILTMSNRAVDHINDIKGRVEATIASAQNQRLSPLAVNGPLLIKLWQHLKRVSIEEKYDLMLDHPSDLYQLDSSYVYDAKKMEFIVFVHVPMLPPQNRFTLYRFAPFPIVHPTNKNITKMIDVGEQTYLAINSNNVYRVMSSIDVNACTKRGILYFCAERNAVYQDLEETCLGALYRTNAEKVSQHCKFQTKAPSEFVLPSGGRRWLIYSPEPQLVSVKCPRKNEAAAPVSIRGQTLLTLMEGCTLKLKRAIISTDDNFYLDMTIYYGSIEGDLFKGTEASSLAVEMAKYELATTNYTKPDNYDDVKSFEFGSYFSKSNSVLYALIAIVILILLGLFIFFWRKFRRESRIRKNFHLESYSKEKDWSEKFASILFESSRKENAKKVNVACASAPTPSVSKEESTFTGTYREERSHLLNDKNPMPFRAVTPDLNKSRSKSEKALKSNKLNLKNNDLSTEEGVRRRFVLKGPSTEIVSITGIDTKQNPKAAAGKIYPCLGKEKTCYLRSNLAGKYKGKGFVCMTHDQKNGCSGVFLSPESIISASSLITEKDIANE